MQFSLYGIQDTCIICNPKQRLLEYLCIGIAIFRVVGKGYPDGLFQLRADLGINLPDRRSAKEKGGSARGSLLVRRW